MPGKMGRRALSSPPHKGAQLTPPACGGWEGGGGTESPPLPSAAWTLTDHEVTEAHGAEGDEGKVEALQVAPAFHVGEEQRGQQQEEQEAREERARARQPPGLGWVLGAQSVCPVASAWRAPCLRKKGVPGGPIECSPGFLLRAWAFGAPCPSCPPPQRRYCGWWPPILPHSHLMLPLPLTHSHHSPPRNLPPFPGQQPLTCRPPPSLWAQRWTPCSMKSPSRFSTTRLRGIPTRAKKMQKRRAATVWGLRLP
jgi:hypothetical protein